MGRKERPGKRRVVNSVFVKIGVGKDCADEGCLKKRINIESRDRKTRTYMKEIIILVCNNSVQFSLQWEQAWRKIVRMKVV